VALTIFASLGFGMASPYLALSFFPAAARALPKPGPWMERAQQFLAFPMYGTAAWLAWVVSQQVATTQFFGLMVALILFAFAAWAFGASQGQTGKWAMVGRVIALVSLISVAVFLSQLKPNEVDTSQPPAGEEMGVAYTPYSAQTLAALRAEGKPVFVNFTASWCISCLVNERVALSRPDVEAALDEHGITYLKADWTNRDAKIAKALAEFDRAGVPLYLYYPSGGREAQVLPQILTESILLEVFRSDGKI
jgi:thiol:disulfide interchange protein DsbD